MTIVFIILTSTGFLAAITFVLLYAIGSPEWRHSPMGRNLMAKAIVLGCLLGLSLLSLLTVVPVWLWLTGMAALDVVLWWRVTILWKVQHQ